MQPKIPLQYIKFTHQLPIEEPKPKWNHHTGAKWYIQGPKDLKEIQLQSLEHSSWLSLV